MPHAAALPAGTHRRAPAQQFISFRLRLHSQVYGNRHRVRQANAACSHSRQPGACLHHSFLCTPACLAVVRSSARIKESIELQEQVEPKGQGEQREQGATRRGARWGSSAARRTNVEGGGGGAQRALSTCAEGAS